MQVLPVLDLKDGLVVRGIAGNRDQYQPISSQWTSSTNPVDIAMSLRNVYGFQHFYLADLDAIVGAAPLIHLYQDLCRMGFSLLVDAGTTSVEQAKPLIDLGITVIVGLESLPSWVPLEKMCQKWPMQVVFSLDLKNGKPWTSAQAFRSLDAKALASESIELGIQRLLILDIANVGMENGTSTLNLCRSIASSHPMVELIAGGGARSRADLEAISHAGVHRALVATAIHSGALSREDVCNL